MRSAPHGTERMVDLQKQVIWEEAGQGKQGPGWHFEGHLFWLCCVFGDC